MSEIYYNASNFVVENGFIRNPKRYYLEEYFLQKPSINADLAPPPRMMLMTVPAAEIATMNTHHLNFGSRN